MRFFRQVDKWTNLRGGSPYFCVLKHTKNEFIRVSKRHVGAHKMRKSCPFVHFKKIIYINQLLTWKNLVDKQVDKQLDKRENRVFLSLFLSHWSPFLATRRDKQLDKRPKMPFFRVPDFHVLFKIRHLHP